MTSKPRLAGKKAPRRPIDGPQRDRFAEMTERFVALMESGAADPRGWKMPWTQLGSGRPVNAVTGKAYQGGNYLALAIEAIEHDWSSPVWATYQAWTDLDCQVAKGEKSTGCVRWVPKSEREDEQGNKVESSRLIPRWFSLFNIAQVVDAEDKPGSVAKVAARFTPAERTEVERHEAAEAFLSAVPATLAWGGDRAYYSPARDAVQLPEADQFDSTSGLYSTWSHELCHWTGHASRLNREGITKSDGRGPVYAFEELVAELGSAFACAHLGVDNEPRIDHAQYLAGWLSALKDDPKALWRAATQAEKALAYLVEQVGGQTAGDEVEDAEPADLAEAA